MYATDEFDAEDNFFIAPHLWMKSGWMKKVVDKVEMSYVVNVLEIMLEFVLETNL